MRRLVFLVLLAALALPGAAGAGVPNVTVSASTVRGAAPLAVTLTAAGDAVAYHWDLGDGTTADGAVVQHVYERSGKFQVVMTATGFDSQTTEARLAVSALGVSLRAPRAAEYGRRALLRGRIVPAGKRARIVVRQGSAIVGRTRARTNGRYAVRVRVRSTRPFQASFEDALSPEASMLVRPAIQATLQGSQLVGQPLALVARARPAAAGELRVQVFREGRRQLDRVFVGPARVRLSTRAAQRYVVRLSTTASPGFAPARETVEALVRVPSLGPGAGGPSVRLLQQRLRELRFALPSVNGYYGIRTTEAVLAFQKLHWLPRTGTVSSALWARLQRAPVPRPRYSGGTHIEVDKSRQILFDVVGGELRRIVHVSTGATGNTPLGTWHVYRKVPGWDWVLWYPMYFLRGFAVHGYPSVPAWPASHGCVRIPMWLAPTLYAEHAYGTTIHIY